MLCLHLIEDGCKPNLTCRVNRQIPLGYRRAKLQGVQAGLYAVLAGEDGASAFTRRKYPPSGRQQFPNDTVKLGRIAVEGRQCTAYCMDLKHEVQYHMIRVTEFYLPTCLNELPLLPDVFKPKLYVVEGTKRDMSCLTACQ